MYLYQIFEICNFLSLSMRVTQNEFTCHLWHACHRFAIMALGGKIPCKHDSRSSIQHLANWYRVRDNIGMTIIKKL